MEKTYYIGDLDKNKLLEQLWNNSNNSLSNPDYTFDLNNAKKCMKNSYPDYVCGRLIKVDIYNKDQVDYSLYDKGNYDGAFLDVIKKVKKTNTIRYIPRYINLENSNYWHTNSCEQINRDFNL